MQRYIQRELSLLAFQLRVLAQAQDARVPLGERCRFLSITESNMDELLKVRTANLVSDAKRRGSSASLLLKNVRRQISEFIVQQQSTAADLLRELALSGVDLLQPADADFGEQSELSALARRCLNEITPLAFTRGRRPPHIPSGQILIAMRTRSGESCDALIYPLPLTWPRFVPSPAREHSYLSLESLVLWELRKDDRFRGSLLFRILRDEDLDYDENAPDRMEEMERSLRRRGWGRIISLHYDRSPCTGYDPVLSEQLITALELPRSAVNGCDVMLDLRSFRKLAQDLPPQDFYDTFTPRKSLNGQSLMDAMEVSDRMIHVPYESYDPLLELLSEAGSDPDVTEISQTLYRVSDHSPIITALSNAAKAGKKVTVLVELKARFDEEHNLHWARVLRDAGCRVLYGPGGLKVHGKALLIKKVSSTSRSYLHLGTGNYNEDTARAYSDMHLFTCDPELCADAEKLFTALAGNVSDAHLHSLVIAPTGLREFLYEKIRREIENAKQGRPCGIRAKMNSLSDPGMIDMLYQASCAGVPVQLVVRGVCGLRPGQPQLSENIRVVSIVGRYLEHHRIFEFCADGAYTVYLSSADWMPRNLNRRVEITFPVRAPDLAQRLRRILDWALSDNTHAWELLSDDSWKRVPRAPEDEPVDFQFLCSQATRP